MIFTCINSSYQDAIHPWLHSVVTSNPGMPVRLYVSEDVRDLGKLPKNVTVHPIPSDKLPAKPSDELLIEKVGGIYPFSESTYNGMCLRLYVIEALKAEGVKRAIYTDADTVVNKPLDELLGFDLKGSWLGACLDWRVYEPGFQAVIDADNGAELRRRAEITDNYFNSGMLLIDLEKAPGGILSGFEENCHRYFLPDQDYLNEIAQSDVVLIPQTYNCRLEGYSTELLTPELREKIRVELEDCHIAHIVGWPKPWDQSMLRPISKELLAHIRQLPLGLYMKHVEAVRDKVSHQFYSRCKMAALRAGQVAA